MEISFWCCCSFIPVHCPTTNLCTYYDNAAVMSCEKFDSDQFVRIWMKAKPNFQKNLIGMEKLSVKSVQNHQWNGSISWTVGASHFRFYGNFSLLSPKFKLSNCCKILPWNYSGAIMTCTKNYCNFITKRWIKLKLNFHQIWIAIEKSSVK